MEKWRRRGGRIVLAQDANGSEDEADESKAEPGRGDVEIGVCRDEDWAGVVGSVIAGCSSETNAVEGAVDVVL